MSMLANKSFRFVLLLLILAACWYVGQYIDVDTEKYRTFFGQFPLWLAGIIYVFMYVIITFFVVFGAKDVFRIVSAVLYGPYISTLLVFLGELGNACILFHLSRKLGQEFIEQKFKIKSEDLEKHKQTSGIFSAFTIRINPLVPFRLMDLGAGLSQISFKEYFIAIVIASPARILWLQYVLAGVGANLFKDPQYVMQYLTDHPIILVYSGIYFVIVVICTIIAVVLKWLKTRKQKQL